LFKRDPSLLRSATEEILRWTSPVIQFTRIATRDTELHGQKIHEGDVLALFYPSANRDEEVFEEPAKFDITRHPNYHLAFGIYDAKTGQRLDATAQGWTGPRSQIDLDQVPIVVVPIQ
jgi:cytochrome P450